MLYHLFASLADKFEPFNVFRYLTFRTAGAIMTALIISFICGRPIINWLRSVQRDGQPIRTDGPESHLLTKKGTPTPNICRRWNAACRCCGPSGGKIHR